MRAIVTVLWTRRTPMMLGMRGDEAMPRIERVCRKQRRESYVEILECISALQKRARSVVGEFGVK